MLLELCIGHLLLAGKKQDLHCLHHLCLQKSKTTKALKRAEQTFKVVPEWTDVA